MKRKAPFLAIAVAALACLPVVAGEPYIGASWLSTDAELETAVDDFDVDDSGWKVFAGYNVRPFWGFEASYRDMGDFSDVVADSRIDAELEAWEASVRAIASMGRVVELFAKAGASNLSLDGEVDFDGDLSDIGSDDWELMYGLGIAIKFRGSFGLRAEWEEFDTSDQLNTFSVGGFLRF